MSDGPGQCLSRDQMIALIRAQDGACLDDDVSEIDQAEGVDHLGQCPTCAALYDGILEKTTGWGEHLQVIRELGGEATSSEPWVEESVKRIQSALGDSQVVSTSLPVLDGFEILEELGRGASSVVYRARQQAPVREVAIKVLSAAFQNDSRVMTRFRAEADALAQLNHPNIVPVLEVGEQHGVVYYTMPCIRSGSLADRLDGTPWGPRRAASLIRDLATAIHEAHCIGIVHRDLKPGNILIRIRLQADGATVPEEDPETIAQIADFGIAKSVDGGSDLTNTGDLIGTPSYMSPEQITGSPDQIGPLTDVYALGINLYELITGRPPFKAESATQTLLDIVHTEPLRPGRLQRRIPLDLETICLQAIAKQPSSRYLTAADLASDLDRFLAHKPIQARRIRTTERAIKWCQRRPAIASLAGVVLVSLIALLSMWGVFTLQIKKERDRVRETAVQLGKERELALENFDRAFQAINQYMIAVKTNPLLGAEESIEIRKELLQHGTDFYEDLMARNQAVAELPAAELTTEKIRLEQARLFFAVGKMHYITEHFEEASRSFDTAERICRRILGPELVPKNSEDVGLVGAILLSKSKSLGRQGEFERAWETAQVSLRYFQSVAGLELIKVDFENWYLAEAWTALGIAESNLDRVSGMSSLRQAMVFGDRLPPVPDFGLTVAQCCLQLGRLAKQNGHRREAFEYFSRACRRMEQIESQQTDQIRYYPTRADCFSELGDCFFRQTEFEAAIENLTVAVGAQQALYNRRAYSGVGERLEELKNQLGRFRKGRDLENSNAGQE